MPVVRYNTPLTYAITVQVMFVVLKLETWRELRAIYAFHLIGLALEMFKVRTGSWSYPDAGVARITGVSVFSRFIYASVGSYICQTFHRFSLRVGGFRWLPVSPLAVVAYLGFFTHHFTADLRWLTAVTSLATLWSSTIYFTVDNDRYWMPTVQAFILIGAFPWLAENAATPLGAWSYPDQLGGWHLVHAGKFGSRALLITFSFVLVAAIKVRGGVPYGGGALRVVHDRLSPNETTR